MKILSTLVFCLGLISILSAQDIYQKHLGSIGADYLTDMQRLTDGSFIALGYTKSRTADSSYAQLFKLDADMNLVWSKTFSFNNQMQTTNLTLGLGGNIFLSGRTWQTPTATAKQGAFVIKTDATGNTLWNRIISYTGTERMATVIEEADSTLRYFVSGANSSYYIKASKTGVPNDMGKSPTNGAYDFQIRKAIRVSANKYLMVCPIQQGDEHLIMLNNDAIEWAREYWGIFNTGRIFDITVDAKDEIYFAGDYRAGNYELRQVHVGKLTANGLVRWTTVLPLIKLGGTGVDSIWRYTTANHIALKGNTLYVSGNLLNERTNISYGTISAFDTAQMASANLSWRWTRQYGNQTGQADSLARVFVLPNGQILSAGNTGLGGNVNTPNFYFIKTDSSGVSCNFGSYTPVEQISTSAYGGLFREFLGMATPQTTMQTYTDAIPTTTKAPLGSTVDVCKSQLCPPNSTTIKLTPTAVCRLDSVTISATGASSYQWTSTIFSGVRTDSTFKVPPFYSGNFVVNLTSIPRGLNCVDVKSARLTVHAFPTGLPNPVNPSTGQVRAMCAGDSLTLSSGAISSSTVTWGSPTNSPWRAGSAQTNMVVKPTTPGVHKYSTRIVSNLGCAVTGVVDVIVRENVTPSVIFEPIGCPGPNLALRAKPTNGGATPFYDWLIDGNLVNGRNELFLPNAIGQKVQVVMTVGTDICPLPPATRQVRSPIITVSCQGVGTAEVAGLQGLMLFPNPTEGGFTLTLDLETTKAVRFRILNLLGQTIETVPSQTVPSGTSNFSFNLRNAPKGLYLVETTLDNKRVLSKIQVQ